MLSEEAKHEAADIVAVEQLISLNSAAARLWWKAAEEVATGEVKELFRNTAKGLEEAATEMKKVIPRVLK